MVGVFGLVLFLLIVGVVLWAFSDKLDPGIYKIVIGLVVIVALIWLFSALGWVSTPAFR